jgi:RNA polymerase sigma factor (sigma-70 family)
MLTDDQRALVERHIALVWDIVKKRRLTDSHPILTCEDVFQTCALAVCRAAQRYDPKRAAFSTVAYPRIKGAIVDEIRKETAIRVHYDDHRSRYEKKPIPVSIEQALGRRA